MKADPMDDCTAVATVGPTGVLQVDETAERTAGTMVACLDATRDYMKVCHLVEM